jgi:hypothetical protein
MYTALELVQVNQEAGTCTEGATMKSSSYTHSSSFSCHPSVAIASSEAATNKCVNLARKASHLHVALLFLASQTERQ